MITFSWFPSPLPPLPHSPFPPGKSKSTKLKLVNSYLPGNEVKILPAYNIVILILGEKKINVIDVYKYNCWS
jgi:hypothetical protein